MAREVPSAQDWPYLARVQPRGYYGSVFLRDLEPSSARRYAPDYFKGWTQDDHMEAAIVQLERFVRAQGEHHRIIADMEKQYGAGGPLISGGLREHWPEAMKALVRHASRAASGTLGAARFHYALTRKRKPFYEWRMSMGVEL